MEKDRGYKIIAIVALLLSVVGLSVAYAGFTSTLNVGGTATAKSAWKIIWKELDNGTATGYASVDGKTLAIDSTQQAISGTVGTIKAPGDKIVYTWKVRNDGEINANLDSVSLGTLSCAPAANNNAATAASEATALCNALTYSFTYDGSALTASTTGTLAKETEKPVTMTLEYPANATAVNLSGDVTVTLGTTSFIYSQAAASSSS